MFCPGHVDSTNISTPLAIYPGAQYTHEYQHLCTDPQVIAIHITSLSTLCKNVLNVVLKNVMKFVSKRGLY